jgi:exodeoxyribonuclease V alpha subunit
MTQAAIKADGVVLRETRSKGFSVLRVKFFNQVQHLRPILDRDGVATVYCPRESLVDATADRALTPKTRVTCWGHITEAQGRGAQLRAERIYPTPRRTWTIDILKSGFFPGIDDVLAARLWKAFGQDVFKIIQSEPEKLRKYARLTPKKVAYIQGDLERFRSVCDEYFFLSNHGLSAPECDRAVETFGNRTRFWVSRNPYTLLRVSGLDWHRTDALAQSMGVIPSNSMRLRNAFAHAFYKASENGYTAVPRNGLIRRVAAELQADPEAVAGEIAQQRSQGLLVERTDIDNRTTFVARKSVYESEVTAARELARLLSAPAERGDFRPTQDDHFLVDEQRHAVNTVLRNKVAIITGGPGVGKTTVVKSVLNQSELAFGRQRVALAAPTGKAAQRMLESTGIASDTIHTLLELHPKHGFRRNMERPLEVDLVVIDEFSMVDLRLFGALLNALPDHARLVMVGDRNQIPSVGPGAVLRDLIASGRVPVAALNEVHRQAQDSQIIVNAYRAIQGSELNLEEAGRDFHWIDADTDSAIAGHIEHLVGRHIPEEHGIRPEDIQVITPQNNTAVGVDELNLMLRDLINPRQRGRSFRIFGEEFRVGDRIMQIKNDKSQKLNNGDIGLITGIDHARERVWTQFNGIDFNLGYADFEKMRLAYGITIHKSQGSEYGAIIIPVSASHSGMLNPQLIYTAMTRGKLQVYMVGSREALRQGLANKRAVQRHTLLTRALYDTIDEPRLARRDSAQPALQG